MVIPQLVVVILGPLVTLISIPLVILLCFVNETRRLIVSYFLKKQYHGKVTLVGDGSDSIWGYKKPLSSRNVSILLEIKSGIATKENMESLITNVILNHKNSDGKYPYDKLKKIMITEYDYVCWKEDKHFNVKNHVRTLDKDFIHTEIEVMNLLSECSSDMEESKPQWELIIVPKYNDGNGTNQEKSILVVRYLHSYMDGLSFIMLYKEHLAGQFEYVVDPLRFSIPLWKMVVLHLMGFFYGPYLIYKMYLTKSQCKGIKGPNRSTGKEGPPLKNFAMSEHIGTEIIRKIRIHADHATVSNVIATAIVTSMKKVIPTDRMVAEMMVGEVLALLPYPNTDPRNRFTQYSYPIKTEGEDIIEKLRWTKHQSFQNLLGPEPLLYYYVFKLFGRFPLSFLSLFFEGAFNTFFISNVPFSKTKTRFIGGCEVLSVAAWPPQPNDTGISVATMSNNGQIKIAASADSRVLTNEELRQIMKLIPLEITRMAELCK